MEEIQGKAAQEGRMKDAILIAGPTASGKSALALEIAEHVDGVIVNTDSMQGFAILNVLTARPGPEDLARVPHFLYGHVHPSTAYSTGAWLRDVMELIGKNALAGRRPIFVGGTGLYFRALAEGISAMPDIPSHIRERWRHELIERGAPRLHRELMLRDSAMAMQLRPSDGQRIARALEVLDASGRSILSWQSQRGEPLIDRTSAHFFVIEPDREALRTRIDRRFDAMIEQGALEEVRQILALGLDPALPAMKAIGVRELQAVLDGEMDAGAAMERAKIATRQYAKRQSTWFRNQLGAEWQRLLPNETMLKMVCAAIEKKIE
ncbi:tRNA (adenosine(37)-N6)-dimethylallyltransferase MiaA [Mesorhizobium sp. NPDC059054]|uniref:tRNA (adenosine(37)-N6)-dimethylallyltransferase MiaA n=1 Tax=Mesorhizobium sp. NPDC059054 TaxID=3346711 RepID=UPI0036BB34DE